MLEKIINSPECSKYMVTFDVGQIIFTEGDESEDLFVLISGELEILKGNKKISEINKPGELFGEMSVLLGGKRTATVKVVKEVKALKIIKNEIAEFLDSSPEIARDITFMLARRLDETSQILYGLKEFCDQLPDAVTVTNKEGKILTWNSVAEKMYGRTWDDMHYKPVEEIYEEPEEYNGYRDDLMSRYSVREKVLRIKHPEKGVRYIATSTTVLYDGHHNYQGLLSIGRDVTRFREMEQHYHRVRKKIIPLVLAVIIILPAFYFSYKYLTNNKGDITVSTKKDLRNQLGKDFFLLKSLLKNHFETEDRSKTHSILEEFASVQEILDIPYKGIILLNKNMIVFDYLNIKDKDSGDHQIIGSSYSSIDFKGSDKSLHKVLITYRPNESNPMGQKGIEVAFECVNENSMAGWIVFQLDTDEFEEKYGINEDDLLGFRYDMN